MFFQMVQKDKEAINGRGFQEYRLQYQNVVWVVAHEACTCLRCPAHLLNHHAKTYFIKKATWLFLHYYIFSDNLSSLLALLMRRLTKGAFSYLP